MLHALGKEDEKRGFGWGEGERGGGGEGWIVRKGMQGGEREKRCHVFCKAGGLFQRVECNTAE